MDRSYKEAQGNMIESELYRYIDMKQVIKLTCSKLKLNKLILCTIRFDKVILERYKRYSSKLILYTIKFLKLNKSYK